MNTNSMFSLMDFIVVGCGGYILYAYFLLMKKNVIKEGVLMPKGTTQKQCKDLEGYKKFMGNKILIFGISAIVSGGIGLLQDFTGKANPVLYMAAFAIFFIAVIWFVLATRKADKLFWKK